MRPLVVIVFHVLRDRSPEVAFAEDYQSTQALGFGREHESLGEGVQIRASRWQPDRDDAGTLQQLAESSCEQGISVMDEVRLSSKEPSHLVHEVPRDLFNPKAFGYRTDPGD